MRAEVTAGDYSRAKVWQAVGDALLLYERTGKVDHIAGASKLVAIAESGTDDETLTAVADIEAQARFASRWAGLLRSSRPRDHEAATQGR